jgi:tRNA threonylcarbamoyladenosine biosynthesis protein TsaB
VTEKANVLAIDAASPEPAVALLAAGEIFEERIPSDRRASEELLPAIARCLARARLRPDALSRVAACAGPGSFTGLRVGLATAWGFARGADVPFESAGTLEAMAEAARDANLAFLWTALDAGRGDVVAQRFALSGPRAEPLAEPRRGSAAQIARTAAGEPIAALPADLLGSPGPPLAMTPARALVLAAARAPRPAAGSLPRPIYARASAAEEKRGAA